MTKLNNIRRTRAQRDLFGPKRAAEKNYRSKLSGYSGILLIILIGGARKCKFVRDPKGGGMRRLQKTEEFWAH